LWERRGKKDGPAEDEAKAKVDQSKEDKILSNIMDVLEGYEIILETADKKEIEVTEAPDGKILKDSTEEVKRGQSPKFQLNFSFKKS
jgi:hypothetical protein